MSIIYVLIPLAILLVALAIGIFFWAVRSNQFQDLERQGYSILFDDDLTDEQKSGETPPHQSSTDQQTTTKQND